MRRRYKRVLKQIIHNSFSLLFLLAFSVLIAQPHKFEVPYEHNQSDFVLAAYEEMLNEAENEDASIEFESLIVGEDGNTKITYVVQAGDTLSEIAKNFGTTTSTIMEANGLETASTIHPGQRLTITYNEGILYEVESETTIKQFATKYDLNVDDLLSMNYMEDPNRTLEIGTQLFVDLNKVEATKRGLLQKPRYEMIDTPPPTQESAQVQQPTEGTVNGEQPQEPTTYQQDIITAEETDQRLKELEQAEQEPSPTQEPTDTEEPVQPEEQEESSLCADNQCEFNGECYTKPAHARCAPELEDDARTCEDGYTEEENGCVPVAPPTEEQPAEQPVVEQEAEQMKEPAPQQEPEQPEEEQADSQVQQPAEAAPTVAVDKEREEEVVAKWYFNPRKAGFPGHGWGAGHCTEYAAYYWWKHYNINLRKHIRGNAVTRYERAERAGLSVGQTPQKGAIVVMKYGASGWSAYGHVAIVTDIDQENRFIRVQDANFLGRYVVTDHWVDMDSEKNPILGYIYPN